MAPQSSLRSRRASRAGAEHLDGVIDFGEAVVDRHPLCPALHRYALDLDRTPARAAHEVVVVMP